MRLPAFQLHRPAVLADALDLMATYGDDAAFYMGGTELLLLMKLGFASPEHLVDGKRLTELQQLSVAGGQISIGAGVTHRRLARHGDVRRAVPELSRLENGLANVRVRNAGTLGGNLCFAEPHSDPVTLLTALDATVRLAGRAGSRRLAIEEFTSGAFSTALEAGEVMVEVTVPVPEGNARMAYERIAFKERPDVTAAVVLRPGRCAVVIGAIGPRPLRVREAEAALDASGGADIATAVAAVSEAVDQSGASDYHTHLAGVLVSRAHRRL